MLIRRIERRPTFERLKPGDTFQLAGSKDVYMKTNEETTNTIILKTGYLVHTEPETEIILNPTELTIQIIRE